MKKLLILCVSGLLVACFDPDLARTQAFELEKLKMQQQHELEMIRAQQHLEQ